MSIRPLSSELQEKAKNELNEVPERVPDDIQSIKNFLREKPHLNARIDDQWILSFLRGCKFNLQKTKKKLEFFYTLKARTPEFFAKRDPFLPEIQEILQRGIFLFLPDTTDPAGPPVLMIRWDKTDPKIVSIKDFVKVMMMFLDIAIKENDNFVVAGQHILEDFQGFSARYILQMTPGICKKGALCLQDAYPTRIKGLLFVNVPFYFRIIHNIINQVFSKKLQNRVKVYGYSGMAAVSEDIPLSILPYEYGGEGGFADDIASDWKKKVESYRDWFLETSETEG